MILLLFCSSETPLGILHPDLEHAAQEEPGPAQVHPEEDHKDDVRAEHLSYEDWLRDLG